jgi:hypothetical protein
MEPTTIKIFGKNGFISVKHIKRVIISVLYILIHGTTF